MFPIHDLRAVLQSKTAGNAFISVSLKTKPVARPFP